MPYNPNAQAMVDVAAAAALPCFLRSPPFPWIDGRIAAVSTPGQGACVEDQDAVFAAIRRARVGGAFWLPERVGEGGARDPWAEATADRRVDRPEDDAAIIGWIVGARLFDRGGCRLSDAVLRDAAVHRIGQAAYRDPFSGERVGVLSAVALLGEWRRLLDANRSVAALTGMAAWKQQNIARFFWDGVGSPPFLSHAAATGLARRKRKSVAYWPSRTPSRAIADAAAAGVPTWQVEDGFIRSNGLGVECRPPFSIIVDRTGGIHYDPARSSEIETILADHDFDAGLLRRAARLRHRIVEARIGKYGIDPQGAPVALPEARRIVVAIGQVEDDLSVVRGGGGVRDNLAFLNQVRREEPGSFVVYRPHPDVASGLRAGHVAQAVAAGLVDRVDTGGSLFALIERADCVHVLSSLTGFEALLRGREVVVHGMPFYAGWGLTHDLTAGPARRSRRLSLDMLVAGALILAPRYLDPVTGLPCPVETLIERLIVAPPNAAGLLPRFRKALGLTRRAWLRTQTGWR